jgi:hypothetical protein
MDPTVQPLVSQALSEWLARRRIDAFNTACAPSSLEACDFAAAGQVAMSMGEETLAATADGLTSQALPLANELPPTAAYWLRKTSYEMTGCLTPSIPITCRGYWAVCRRPRSRRASPQ